MSDKLEQAVVVIPGYGELHVSGSGVVEEYKDYLDQDQPRLLSVSEWVEENTAEMVQIIRSRQVKWID